MPPKNEAAHHGLRLTMPGAPEEPHIVNSPDTGQPIPGHYHPVIPTPVGGPGEISLDTARRWADDPRYQLTIVPMSDGDAARWRAWWRDMRPVLVHGVQKARRTAAGEETSRVAREIAALEQEA